jgi:hypothetical protein
LLISIFSYEGLKLWVGDEFAAKRLPGDAMLAIGVLFYWFSLGFVSPWHPGRRSCLDDQGIAGCAVRV